MKTKDELSPCPKLMDCLGEFDLNMNDNTLLSGKPKDNRVFLFPGFSKPDVQILSFLDHFKGQPNGVLFLPAAMDAKWFHELVLSRAQALYVFKKRPRLYDPDLGDYSNIRSLVPLCLAFYGDNMWASKLKLDRLMTEFEGSFLNICGYKHKQDTDNV